MDTPTPRAPGWYWLRLFPGALPLLTNAPPPAPTGPGRSGTRTHCQRGHPRTPTTRTRDGRCVLCRKLMYYARYPLPARKRRRGGTRTHCARGHARIPENRYTHGRCKPCALAQAKARWRRRKGRA